MNKASVPMDHVAAYMWYKAAADRGEHRATAALKSLSFLMTDAQIKQATVHRAET
jgi:TPR repeat protein